mmetsp:Transcript_117146/g.203429  ORF Transcript_117146/g.203429 Transcript_117146/m.203429 type:complete len:245 (-) Transcript_117146:40-774(-)
MKLAKQVLQAVCIQRTLIIGTLLFHCCWAVADEASETSPSSNVSDDEDGQPKVRVPNGAAKAVALILAMMLTIGACCVCRHLGHGAKEYVRELARSRSHLRKVSSSTQSLQKLARCGSQLDCSAQEPVQSSGNQSVPKLLRPLCRLFRIPTLSKSRVDTSFVAATTSAKNDEDLEIGMGKPPSEGAAFSDSVLGEKKQLPSIVCAKAIIGLHIGDVGLEFPECASVLSQEVPLEVTIQAETAAT